MRFFFALVVFWLLFTYVGFLALIGIVVLLLIGGAIGWGLGAVVEESEQKQKQVTATAELAKHNLLMATRITVLEEHLQRARRLLEITSPLRRTKAVNASCWDVLGVADDSSEAVIEAAYRFRAKAAHPDKGGSHERMQRLNIARDAALKTAEQRAE